MSGDERSADIKHFVAAVGRLRLAEYTASQVAAAERRRRRRRRWRWRRRGWGAFTVVSVGLCQKQNKKKKKKTGEAGGADGPGQVRFP